MSEPTGDPAPGQAEQPGDAAAADDHPQPVDGSDPSGVDLARQALAQARAAARERGAEPRPTPNAPRRPRRAARSGEPQLFGEAVREWLAERGLADHLAMGGIFGRWAQIVGERLAEHVRPETFAEGRLVLVADSPAWASQVRALAPQLVRRVNEELGEGTVQVIEVRGPGRDRGGPGRLRARR